MFCCDNVIVDFRIFFVYNIGLMGRRGFYFIVLAVMFLNMTNFAYANVAPQYPSCVNPQGELIASYDSGVHGIVGSTHTYIGSDKVYRISQTQTTQCFCDENTNGIQTNWLKTDQLTEDEIRSLELSGWIIVADGSAWGLDEGQYLAKNSNFSCKSSTDSSSRSTSSSSSSSSSSNGVGGTEIRTVVNNIGGKVLGLASTGSASHIYSLWLYGLSALTAGVFLAWVHKHILGKK